MFGCCAFPESILAVLILQRIPDNCKHQLQFGQRSDQGRVGPIGTCCSQEQRSEASKASKGIVADGAARATKAIAPKRSSLAAQENNGKTRRHSQCQEAAKQHHSGHFGIEYQVISLIYSVPFG